MRNERVTVGGRCYSLVGSVPFRYVRELYWKRFSLSLLSHAMGTRANKASEFVNKGHFVGPSIGLPNPHRRVVQGF